MKSDIFWPNGPRALLCRPCGVTISSNALARAAHERGLVHRKKILELQNARRAFGLPRLDIER